MCTWGCCPITIRDQRRTNSRMDPTCTPACQDRREIGNFYQVPEVDGSCVRNKTVILELGTRRSVSQPDFVVGTMYFRSIFQHIDIAGQFYGQISRSGPLDTSNTEYMNNQRYSCRCLTKRISDSVP